jgi:hypothetical protein
VLADSGPAVISHTGYDAGIHVNISLKAGLQPDASAFLKQEISSGSSTAYSPQSRNVLRGDNEDSARDFVCKDNEM